MFDARLRPLIDKPLNAAGRRLSAIGISASAVTAAGLAAGVAAAGACAVEHYALAFSLILVNRVLDGLDGAVARASAPTDSGGYLDIVVDYVFYASVPLAFAIANPTDNALASAALLAGFCLTCSSFMAFAAIAARRGLDTETHGRKSFFYSTGLVEGTETIVFFLLMTSMPRYYPVLASVFAVLCVLTALQRSILALNTFR